MAKQTKTISEIFQQPAAWRRCLDKMAQSNFHDLALKHDPRMVPWVLVGCGTSYYLAQAAAATLTGLLKAPTFAVPASEVLLQPELVFPRGIQAAFPVLISRSGQTSEVLEVADFLRRQGAEFLVVTCDGKELARTSDHVLQLDVREESTVMTSSFSTMLIALQYIAASVAGNIDFLEGLHRLPECLDDLLEQYAPLVEEFAEIGFDDIAALGQGALYPIAAELALKVMESSSTYAQYFHTLEFRHGPKSIAGPRALVAGLVSDSGAASETAVLLEMKKLGSRTLVVANAASPELRRASDLLIEMNLPGPELSRLAAYGVWGQLLGTYRGIGKGLDPDNPKNLSRVVMI